MTDTKFFQSEDPSLAQYNGKRITVTDRWLEACGDEEWEVVQVRFEDGTEYTAKPSEVRDVHPSAEQYRCGQCQNLALYPSDHKTSCPCHPIQFLGLTDLN